MPRILHQKCLPGTGMGPTASGVSSAPPPSPVQYSEITIMIKFPKQGQPWRFHWLATRKELLFLHKQECYVVGSQAEMGMFPLCKSLQQLIHAPGCFDFIPVRPELQRRQYDFCVEFEKHLKIEVMT